MRVGSRRGTIAQVIRTADEGETFMRRILYLAGLGTLTLAGALAAAIVTSQASAHSDPCHSAHTCPSDHHTYVWTDPATGLGWDCAKPDASEYNPAVDTTTISWDAYTYKCRPAGSAPPATTTTSTATTTATTTTATTS